jgi:hypothetical protein
MVLPSFVRWTRKKADTKKSKYYHRRLKSLIDDNKTDERDIKNLDDIECDTTDAYSKGKINEIQYNCLKNEISIQNDKIFRKNIDS